MSERKDDVIKDAQTKEKTPESLDSSFETTVDEKERKDQKEKQTDQKAHVETEEERKVNAECDLEAKKFLEQWGLAGITATTNKLLIPDSLHYFNFEKLPSNGPFTVVDCIVSNICYTFSPDFPVPEKREEHIKNCLKILRGLIRAGLKFDDDPRNLTGSNPLCSLLTGSWLCDSYYFTLGKHYLTIIKCLVEEAHVNINPNIGPSQKNYSLETLPVNKSPLLYALSLQTVWIGVLDLFFGQKDFNPDPYNTTLFRAFKKRFVNDNIAGIIAYYQQDAKQLAGDVVYPDEPAPMAPPLKSSNPPGTRIDQKEIYQEKLFDLTKIFLEKLGRLPKPDDGYLVQALKKDKVLSEGMISSYLRSKTEETEVILGMIRKFYPLIFNENARKLFDSASVEMDVAFRKVMGFKKEDATVNLDSYSGAISLEQKIALYKEMEKAFFIYLSNYPNERTLFRILYAATPEDFETLRRAKLKVVGYVPGDTSGLKVKMILRDLKLKNQYGEALDEYSKKRHQKMEAVYQKNPLRNSEKELTFDEYLEWRKKFSERKQKLAEKDQDKEGTISIDELAYNEMPLREERAEGAGGEKVIVQLSFIEYRVRHIELERAAEAHLGTGEAKESKEDQQSEDPMAVLNRWRFRVSYEAMPLRNHEKELSFNEFVIWKNNLDKRSREFSGLSEERAYNEMPLSIEQNGKVV